MPENRYDNTTRPDTNASEQAASGATEQQRTNAIQQNLTAQQTTTPDPAVQLKQNQPELELRNKQAIGQGMNVW